jgi:hypothetical protein
LNPSHDGVYHFESIYIAKGVTLVLSSATLPGPVFWLSQGAVQVDGTIDLNGTAPSGSAPALAGAGGYPGGRSGKPGYHPSSFDPNPFLVPLVGGFGGDGSVLHAGGGGGGALLIASSTSITVNGRVTANGGEAPESVGGGGGAIRLVAPVIDGSGLLSAKGGLSQGANGRIRLEAMENRFGGAFNGTPVFYGKPFRLFLPPDPQPSIRVSIDGIPLGNREFSVKTSSAVQVSVEARHIPPGTTVDLEFFAEDGTAWSVTTTPLAGTFELSTAIASIGLLKGTSQGIVKVEWRQAEAGGTLR